MDVDPGEVIEIFRPARKWRRLINGARCAVCHMTVHHSEAAIVRTSYLEKTIHTSCADLLVEACHAANNNDIIEEHFHSEAALD